MANDAEGILLRGIETRLLQLHDRASSMSDLVDVPELTPQEAAQLAAASNEFIKDIGEISRYNMLLVEEMMAAVRSLLNVHEAKAGLARLPFHRRVSPLQALFLAVALLIGVTFTGYLMNLTQGFPEGCARGIREVMARRAS